MQVFGSCGSWFLLHQKDCKHMLADLGTPQHAVLARRSRLCGLFLFLLVHHFAPFIVCHRLLHAGHFTFLPSSCTTEGCAGDFAQEPVAFKDIDYVTRGEPYCLGTHCRWVRLVW